ncbi:MAG: outer membrane beta-barrel protein [Legionellales bacterium]|nr:outer membrane beta-barrel protein [Legionellales bacterium]
MLKKIALFSVAAGLAVASSAALAAAGGLYVGAGVGYQTLANKITGTDTTNAVTTSHVMTLQGDGALGTLFVGYGFCLSNNLWLGVELNGQMSGAKITNTLNDTTNTVSDTFEQKARAAWGVDFRPGYFVTPNTKAYAVLGWQQTRYKTTETETVAGVATTANDNYKRNGFRYGGGMEVNLTNQLGLRAEWTQVRNKSRTVPNTALNQTLTFKNTNDQFLVSAVYTIGDVANIGGGLNSLG